MGKQSKLKVWSICCLGWQSCFLAVCRKSIVVQDWIRWSTVAQTNLFAAIQLFRHWYYKTRSLLSYHNAGSNNVNGTFLDSTLVWESVDNFGYMQICRRIIVNFELEYYRLLKTNSCCKFRFYLSLSLTISSSQITFSFN